MKLCTILPVAALIFACQLCVADSGKAAVCVVSSDRFVVPSVKRLAIALSKEKLRSGRLVVGVPLSLQHKSDLPAEVQNAGCDYLVRLQADFPDQLNVNADIGIIGSPAPSSYVPLPDHEGLNLPSLNYEIEEVGTNKVLATGSQIGVGRPFRTDYSALSRKIARQVK